MDQILKKLIQKEEKRQASVINLIASENYVSRDVRRALESIFTNKYAEGYPGARYYGGNEIVDKVEMLAQKRALELFSLSDKKWAVNVQPYSGSPANLAIYLALLPLGGKIMGLRLDMGGHLTHGHKVSASGIFWRAVPYILDEKSELLDYRALKKLAIREKHAIVIAGFTAYSRIIDFKKFRDIANAAGAYLVVDMSHFAGLVAGGVYPSPFAYADVVMTTGHKTLRGPRSALIFSKKELASKINRAIFPGVQGGPHVNQIAALAVALEEARGTAFKKYARQIIQNAKTFAQELKRHGWRIVSGGTDSHLFLVDTYEKGISGREAERQLEHAGIIVNKNAIPYDTRSPLNPSGIRIGTPAVTTRGMREQEMILIASWMHAVLTKNKKFRPAHIAALARRFPLP